MQPLRAKPYHQHPIQSAAYTQQPLHCELRILTIASSVRGPTNWEGATLIERSNKPNCQNKPFTNSPQIKWSLQRASNSIRSKHTATPQPSAKVTHNDVICVRADQLVGSDPDREVERAELPNKPFTNSATCNHFAPNHTTSIHFNQRHTQQPLHCGLRILTILPSV
jgi:hypothetical protein